MVKRLSLQKKIAIADNHPDQLEFGNKFKEFFQEKLTELCGEYQDVTAKQVGKWRYDMVGGNAFL